MRLAVNLLNDTPKGHTWIQVALDLSAGDFELGHVRSMHRDLCRHLQMEPSALRLIGVSRWKPVLDLQLPEPAAHALVEAFEASPDFLPRAFTSPPIESIRLDRLSAERFSIATTETDPWTTLFGSTSEEDLRRLAAAIWKAVRGGLKIALIMIAALVAFLLSSVYTLVTAIFGRLGRSADRAGLPLPKATLSRLPD